jgi:hypothetical protein
MKNTLIVTLFIISFSSSSFAQTGTDSKIKFGLKTGLNISSFTKDVGVFDKTAVVARTFDTRGYEKYFRGSLLLGLTATYPVTSAFALKGELLYTGRGAAYRRKNGSVVIISSQGAEKAYDYYIFKINYVEVPITANLNLSAHSSSSIHFSLYGGIAPAFAADQTITFNSHQTSSSSPIANSTSKNEELKYVRSFNVSSLVGFEISKKERKGFFVDGRLSNTLLPVFKSAASDEGFNLNTSMWTCTLGVGVYL